MNKLSSQVVQFLKTNKTIDYLNFAFVAKLRTYKVYPSAYRSDLVKKINEGTIEVVRQDLGMDRGIYKYGGWSHDTLMLDKSFNISNPLHQGTLIHECTHAHFDIQNFGSHSLYENEGAAWLAEAVYLTALNRYVTSGNTLKVKCQDAAIQILRRENGKQVFYKVKKTYSEPIVNEARKKYGTRATKLYSNGVWRLHVKCN